MRLIITTLALAMAGAGIRGSAQQLVQIPDKIQVADMELTIREGAKPILDGYVKKLVANNRYFRQMVDRADAYLPIVERIFQEEGLPLDFRYLVIQESSLVSYLVSTSNAVGYWQFKQATAVEMGLRVDEEIDERMAIVPSSRSAARYLKRHNQYMHNWIYSTLAYYAGLGGAKALINPEMIGSKTLDIDENTHWYVLKFLAHKIAFEPHLYRNAGLPALRIAEYSDCENKTVEELARETNYSVEQIQFYNRWILKGYVPGDRDYTLILPQGGEDIQSLPADAGFARVSPPASRLEPWREKVLFGLIEKPVTAAEPVVLADGKSEVPVFFDWNGIKAIQAKKGDNSSKLALLAGISREEFLDYNDLRVFDPIIPGEVYYADNKKNRAKIPFHTVQHGESLWDISQRYGIRMKSLMAKNRMDRPEKLKPGRVMWLRHFRPEEEPIRYEAVAELPKKQTVASVQIQEQEKRKSDSLTISKSETRALAVIGNDSAKTEISESPVEIAATDKVQTNVVPAADSTEASKADSVAEAKTEALALASVSTTVPDLSQVKTAPAVEMPEPVNGEIEVKQGMTWYRISRHYHYSLDSLHAWNGPDLNLRSGRKISLQRKMIVAKPENAVKNSTEALKTQTTSGNARQETYEVKQGDSLFGIAKKHGMSVSRLLEINQKSNNDLRAGELLKVELQP